MACRVGMSTNPQERIQHWKDKEGHTHSKILARRLTYAAAQIREEEGGKGAALSFQPRRPICFPGESGGPSTMSGAAPS